MVVSILGSNIEGGVSSRHAQVIILIVIFREDLFHHEKSLDGDFNLRLVLCTASTELLEVFSRAREVFEEDCQLDIVGFRIMLGLGLVTLSLVCNLLERLFELVCLFGFLAAKGHRDSC